MPRSTDINYIIELRRYLKTIPIPSVEPESTIPPKQAELIMIRFRK